MTKKSSCSKKIFKDEIHFWKKNWYKQNLVSKRVYSSFADGDIFNAIFMSTTARFIARINKKIYQNTQTRYQECEDMSLPNCFYLYLSLANHIRHFPVLNHFSVIRPSFSKFYLILVISLSRHSRIFLVHLLSSYFYYSFFRRPFSWWSANSSFCKEIFSDDFHFWKKNWYNENLLSKRVY